jgi:predicted DNA-binding transcriptional regulator YafY
VDRVGRGESEKPYHWLRLASRAVPLPEVDMADALSLVLAEELLGKLAPASILKTLEPKLAKARSRLTASQKNSFAQWKDRVRYLPPGLPFLPPRVDERFLGLVKQSILEERQLKVRYSGRESAKADEKTLHPLALVQHGPITYLVATEFEFTKPCLYALHRFRAVTVAEEPARRPEGFTLDGFLAEGGMQFGEGPQIRLKAVVTNNLACYLQESPLSPDQKLKAIDPEHYRFEVVIKDSWQLQFWILSQGAEIVVEKPTELRERIRGCLRSSLDGYHATRDATGQKFRCT